MGSFFAGVHQPHDRLAVIAQPHVDDGRRGLAHERLERQRQPIRALRFDARIISHAKHSSHHATSSAQRYVRFHDVLRLLERNCPEPAAARRSASCQGSKTATRTQARIARAALDGENAVIP